MPQRVPQGGRPGKGSGLNVDRFKSLSRRLSRLVNAQGKSAEYESSYGSSSRLFAGSEKIWLAGPIRRCAMPLTPSSVMTGTAMMSAPPV